ncbi:MAG: hypothetical protein IKG95_07505 [Bacteroidales bacterium]|nr:hypothetical protein [Bacteroidales bacterium]
MKNIVTYFMMVISVVVFSNCTNKGRITELQGCSFEPEQLVSEIMQEYDADSVSITYRRFRLEPSWPLIKAPVVEIFNPRMKSLDFKTLDKTMKELDKLDDEIHLRDSLEEELKPIAERIVSGCNTRRYNELIVEILKVDETGERTHQIGFSYIELLDIKRTRIPYDKPSADAELYLKLRQQ